MNPTQHHVLVADVIEDIVLTKEGGAALVLESTSLNFSLLSDKEKEAMIFAYAGLLNSLSFPVQILIRSKQKDISRYIQFLENLEVKQNNQKLKDLTASYKNFVATLVKKKHVLEKRFFFVISFSPLELGLAATLGDIVPAARRRVVPFSKEYVVKKAKTALYPRRDHLIRQIGRLGIKLRQLTTKELADLFFEIYNKNGSEGDPPFAKATGGKQKNGEPR